MEVHVLRTAKRIMELIHSCKNVGRARLYHFQHLLKFLSVEVIVGKIHGREINCSTI